MIEGIILPLITPFDRNGAVDERMFCALLDAAIGSGADALFVLGSVGQGPALTYEERARLARLTIEQTKNRVPVIMHVGTTDLRSTAQLASEAADAGVDSIAVVTPYYYTDHTSEEVDLHFMGVAQATKLPIVVYNNPKYAGINITAPWLAKLAKKIPSIRGIKLSYASTPQTLQYVEQVGEQVAVYAGSIINLLPTVPFGVKGAINPPSILFPELAVKIWKALKNEDWAAAFRLQDRVNRASMSIENLMAKEGRVVIQEGLRLLGFDVQKYPRWESPALSEAGLIQLKSAMAYAKVEEVSGPPPGTHLAAQ